MNPAELINWFLEQRWRYNTKDYSTVYDYMDLLKGEVPQYLNPTQKNKPSPVTMYTYDQVRKYVNARFPQEWKVGISFVGWTNSMEPIFDHGDLTLTIPYEHYKNEFGELREGAIAIYKLGDTRIIHRCVGRLGDGRYVFRGDNNFRADPPVKEEQIIDVLFGVFYTKDKLIAGQD